MIESFPLQWPAGYPRTARPAGNYRFYPSTFASEIKGLKDELWRMSARSIVISTNIPTKNDGNPYSTYSKPADTGVAVYFTVDNKAMALCCDKWNTVEANLRALVMSVDAMRGLDRWGVSEIMNRAFMGFKALLEKAAGFPWWEVLGVSRECTKKEVLAAYKKKIKIHHPDNGGEPHKWQELQEAYEQGLKQTNVN
jgi:hypothetical protein